MADYRYLVPGLPKAHTRRRRLLDRLDSAAASPLVLVSAPAGTGKTTLVADWVRTRRAAHTTGWVSFEEGDEALWPQVTTVLGDLGVDLSVRPISSAPHSMDAHLLSALAGAVTEHASPLTIVLDHFELTDLDQAHDLDYLLRHCAGRLQVVVTTRVDPVLPLYRYRLANSVTEVRAADLAFTDEEAADVLVLSGFRLRPETVRALNTRTNGWVTGLRFAARALAGADDPDRAVARVIAETGDMGEYLLGEVLDAQEPAVRALLLESSIPDVLHPGLVEALPHHSAVRELGMLTRMNVFVEALEDSPGCYRYPPFFRELLRAQLAYESPDRPGELHRICARWFVDHGSASAAIGHLAATGAWPEAAARTIEELLVSDLLRDGSRGGLGRVLRDMPEDVGTEEAALVRAALALADGDLKGSADALDAARDARGAATVTWPVELTCAVLDAVTARFGDDLENADVTVAQALEVASADDHRASLPAALGLRALSLICRGTAALRHGDLPAAATAAAAAAESTLPGLEWIEQAALGQLAMVQAIVGELELARRTAAEAAAVADRIGLPSERRSPAAALGMALVSLEQYDLDAVDAQLEQASRPLLATENPVWRGLLAQVRSGLLRARGQVPDALAVLEKVLSDLAPGDAWLIDRLRVETAATLLQAEDVDLAQRQLEAVRVPDGFDVALLSARVLAARGEAAGSARALARAQANPAPLRTRVAALLLEASGIPRPCSADRARSDVLKALRLARPESLRRPFLEAPGPVRRLGEHDPHVKAQGRWLTVAEPEARSPAGSVGGGPPDAPEMVERLTAKEREILEHLAELLTTEEIARTMFISVNTVRTHIRSILRKLGVSRRNAAVRKARELGLLQA